MIDRILLIAACVSFGCATVGIPSNVNMVALGLLLWCLTLLIHG